MSKENIPDNFFSQLKKVEQILIPHRHFAHVVERIEYVYELSKNGAEPRHTLLVGESGAGKTWVARYIKSLHPEEESENGTIPILIVEIPPVPTLKTLAEHILMALGDPLAHRGTTADKRYRALKLIRSCKVEMIILDEFQHFVDNGIKNSIQSVADWLKMFIEDCQIPCLLMGLPRCEVILHVNEQLRRRFSSRLDLLPFSIDSEQSEIEFRAVLHEIDQLLPTERRSKLGEVELSQRIFFASNGLIGYVRKLITAAYELSVLEQKSCLDEDLLSRAFVEFIWNEASGSLNPFHRNFKFRKLDQPGEPFAPVTPAPRKRVQELAKL